MITSSGFGTVCVLAVLSVLGLTGISVAGVRPSSSTSHSKCEPLGVCLCALSFGTGHTSTVAD